MKKVFDKDADNKKVYSLEEIWASPKKKKMFMSFLPPIPTLNMEVICIIKTKEPKTINNSSIKLCYKNKYYKKLRTKLLKLKHSIALKSLHSLIVFEKYKKQIMPICMLVYLIFLLYGNFLLLGLLTFIVLITYIPLIISNEYIKKHVIIQAFHKRKPDTSLTSEIIKETHINKATILYNINQGVYPESKPELYSNSEMQFIYEFIENLKTLNYIIKDSRLLIKKDGIRYLMNNNC